MSIRDKEMARSMYASMFRIRRFEEEVFEFYKRGLMPGLAHLYIGEEAVAVGACAAIRPDDYIGSTHRGHGHLVARGADVKRMMAEILGKKTGYCQGKGGSMHIMDMSLGILGANGIVGGGIPIATGAGYSCKYRGTDQVVLCFFGDGASNEGTFHESINMAAAWDLPVVYIIENNHYGITVDIDRVTKEHDLAKRAVGYGIDGYTLTQIAAETRDLVARAKEGRLAPAEYSDGTFSLSNLGMFGIENFTAIINPPEAAILSVSSVRKKAVVITDENGEDQIAIRPMINIQLSVDHRIIDGLLASRFVEYMKELLENPVRILM